MLGSRTGGRPNHLPPFRCPFWAKLILVCCANHENIRRPSQPLPDKAEAE